MTLGDLLRAFADRSRRARCRRSTARRRRPSRRSLRLAARRGPGRCSSRCAACTPTARRSRAKRSAAARSPSLSESAAPAGRARGLVQVPDARLALAALAATSTAIPASELVLVGITGTNGKTTTSYLLASIFEAAGIALRPDRHRRLSDRPDGDRSGADDAGGAGAAGDAARHGVAGLRRLRDGGVVARAGAAARRLPAVRAPPSSPT